MLRVSLCFLLLGLASFGSGAAVGQTPDARAELLLSQPSWEFGDVWADEKASFVLQIKNGGTADLLIHEVTTSCGCTAAQPDRRVIPPGETTAIRVVYDTHGKQGKQTSKVIIRSNDPQKPRVEFPVTGFVKRAVTRDPLGGLVIRTLNASPGDSGVVTLENQMPEPMKLELLSNTADFFDLQVVEVAPGLKYQVVGRTKKALAPGRYTGEIVFKTGLSREPEFRVPAALQVLNEVELSPPVMLFANDDKNLQRVVRLYYYGPDGIAGFQVLGVDCDHPDVKVELGPTVAPDPWMATIKPTITAQVIANVRVPHPQAFPPKGIPIIFRTNIKGLERIELIATTNRQVMNDAMYGQRPQLP